MSLECNNRNFRKRMDYIDKKKNSIIRTKGYANCFLM